MAAIRVENAKELEKMPTEYRNLLVHQVKGHTEGEMSGADDYIKIFYPMAPNVEEKHVCCERAVEELDHYARGAKVLADMGIDVSYMVQQDLKDRKLYATEAVQDIPNWEGRGLFSFLAEGAVLGQLSEMADSSHRPLAESFPKILADEKLHIAHGFRITREFCRTPEGRQRVQDALKLWWPRALDVFGKSDSDRSRAYVQWGLRKMTNGEARDAYMKKVKPKLTALGLEVPPDHEGRKFM